MAHYHIVEGERVSLGIPDGELHFHGLAEGVRTSSDPDIPGHTHNTPSGIITSTPIEVGGEAFSDIQKEISYVFGNHPEEVYLESFEDKDPKAKVRNRGTVIFSAESPDVTDDKDHFPINSEDQARAALSRASQSDFEWYKGTKEQAIAKIKSAVRKAFPSIKISA
jgi:hypothetical protein